MGLKEAMELSIEMYPRPVRRGMNKDLVEKVAKWLFENKEKIRNPQFYAGWEDEVSASPYCENYMIDLAKSIIPLIEQEVRKELMEWYAKHAHSVLFDGEKTTEGDPIEREIVVFGGKPYKEKGYRYWISVNDLQSLKGGKAIKIVMLQTNSDSSHLPKDWRNRRFKGGN